MNLDWMESVEQLTKAATSDVLRFPRCLKGNGDACSERFIYYLIKSINYSKSIHAFSL